jgi:hypothetical protein
LKDLIRMQSQKKIITDRAKNLYAILGASLKDNSYNIGKLANGKWALISETIWGYKFAVGD